MKKLRPPAPGRACGLRVTGEALPPAGFSLIELLAVVVIMLVLTTIYWNHGQGGMKMRRACSANLQKVHMALQIYAADFKGRYPFATNAHASGEVLSLLVPRYTADTSIFICPSSSDRRLPSGEPFSRRRISYAYCMGRQPDQPTQWLMSDRQIDTHFRRQGDCAFSETGKAPGNNHGSEGGNVLFADGRVEFVPPRIPFPLDQSNGAVMLNP